MPKHLLDDLRVFAVLKQQRGEGMPQIMEPYDAQQPEGLYKWPEVLLDTA